MKKLFALILFVFSLQFVNAQRTGIGNDSAKYVWYKYQYGSRMARAWNDSVFIAPADTTFSKYGWASKGSSIYYGNGSYWTLSSGSSGSSDTVRTLFSPDGSLSLYYNNGRDTINAVVTNGLFSKQNEIISTGGAAISGDTVIIYAPIIYRLAGIQDTFTTDIRIVIPPATADYWRTDAIVIPSLGVIDTLMGIEDTIKSYPRSLDSGMLLMAYVDVHDDTVKTVTLIPKLQSYGLTFPDVNGVLTNDSVAFRINPTTKELFSSGGLNMALGKHLGFGNPGDYNTSITYDASNFLKIKSYSGNLSLISPSDSRIVLSINHNSGSASTGYLDLKNFGFGTTSPDASAAVDIISTTKGLLIPRLTTTQRNAISGPTKSLLVFNSTLDSFQYYNAGWHTIGGDSGGTPSWGLTGTAGTNPSINFLGTTDNQPVNIRANNLLSMTIGTSYGNVSMGSGSVANANSSFASGIATTASNAGASAMGYNTIASGTYSTALGNGTTASGSASTALGGGTVAVGGYSLASGIQSYAVGEASAALGFTTIAKAYGSLSIGSENNQSDTPDPNTPDPSDRIFQIGMGGYVNAMTVLRNGGVGIGTTTPDSTLTNELGLYSKRGVRFSGLIQSGFDTSTYKPVVVNSSGILSKMNWPASSSVTLASGTYTPTATIVANLDATPTLSVCQYLRVGNTVTVSGEITVDPTTASGTLTRARFTLPIASALTISAQCSGNANIGIAGTVALGAAIKGDATNDQAEIAFGATYTSSLTYNFSFTYQVL